MSKKEELFTCRDVLWYLVFCGFAVNYMLGTNLNLTIIAMVLPYSKSATIIQRSTEDNGTIFGINETSQDDNVSFSFPTTTPSLENVTVNKTEYEDRFAWNEYQQGLVLGAYYWLYSFSQIPGGLLAKRYGAKRVFGLGNFLMANVALVIPYAMNLHVLIVLRMLQGLTAGAVWPAMHDMTAKWIPPNERSRFVSAYLGSSVGVAITYPLCAAVTSFFGWGASFKVSSLLGTIWYFLWYFLVYDSPQQHPRISDDEKNYITSSIAGSIDNEEIRIPWRSILLSGPVWITIIVHWSSMWGYLTLLMQAPSYLNYIHEWNINAVGILAGAPHILQMIFSYFFSAICDWLLRTERMNLTNIRKLSTFFCTGIQGVFIIALGFSGWHPMLAIVFMTAGIMVNGAISASTLANFIDLSPNYASILLGLCNTIIVCIGFISPTIVGILTNNNQTWGQWRLIFLIAGIKSIAGCIIYMMFGTAKEQPWNQYVKLETKKLEMQKLTPEAIKRTNDAENANNIE